MSSTPYRKVVIPLDGSPLAEQMLDYITYVTSPTETELVLISLFDLLQSKSIQLDHSPVRLVAAVLADLERYLNQHREKLERAGYRIHTYVSEGDIAHQIMKLAKDIEADLIAMTTQGHSGFVRFALGSIAERVVQGADLPVLLVKESTNTATAPAQRLLVPLDGSQLAEQALKPAAALAKTNGASILLFQAIQPPERVLQHVLFQNNASADSSLALWRSNALEYLRRIANDLQATGITCSYQVALGAPDQAICEHAAHENADMILMTTHGMSGLRRWVYGSVTNKVLRSTCGPVIVIHSTQAA